MNGEIRYQFAIDDAGKSVDVFALHSRDNIAGRMFQCLACNERMVAHLGRNVTHHFAHKPNSQCSRETYLHKLGKLVFKEEYEKCLANGAAFSYELEQSRVCNQYPGDSEHTCRTKPKLLPYDLTRDFPKLSVEVEHDDFRPDILLESQDRRKILWIEIYVTHKCSPSKCESGKRIIEIQIKSEADLEPIRNHLLSVSDSRIKFYEFSRNVPQDLCSWPFRNCNLKKRVFRIFKDGRWDIRYSEKDEDHLETAADIVWHNEAFEDIQDQPMTSEAAQRKAESILKACVEEASGEGVRIRACGFCEHFDHRGAGECQKFNEDVEWRRAIKCPDYSMVDSEKLTAIIHDLE